MKQNVNNDVTKDSPVCYAGSSGLTKITYFNFRRNIITFPIQNQN